jgi:hypothetical protein
VDLAGYEGDVQIILTGTAAGADADLTSASRSLLITAPSPL